MLSTSLTTNVENDGNFGYVIKIASHYDFTNRL